MQRYIFKKKSPPSLKTLLKETYANTKHEKLLIQKASFVKAKERTLGEKSIIKKKIELKRE